MSRRKGLIYVGERFIVKPKVINPVCTADSYFLIKVFYFCEWHRCQSKNRLYCLGETMHLSRWNSLEMMVETSWSCSIAWLSISDVCEGEESCSTMETLSMKSIFIATNICFKLCAMFSSASSCIECRAKIQGNSKFFSSLLPKTSPMINFIHGEVF